MTLDKTDNPGDFRSWKSPQTLPTCFIGQLEFEKRIRNLKQIIRKAKNIHSNALNSSEGTVAPYRSFEQILASSQEAH